MRLQHKNLRTKNKYESKRGIGQTLIEAISVDVSVYVIIIIKYLFICHYHIYCDYMTVNKKMEIITRSILLN